MRTSVLTTVLAVALVIGTACKGPDGLDTEYNHFGALARGANVALATDTLASASATVTANPDSSFGLVYTTTATGIDSVVLYTATSAAAITSATAGGVVLCAAAACNGSGTSVKVATAVTLTTSMRNYGVQMVFFATGARPNNGVMRGLVYPLGQ